ncbi:helix-turn-helix transcriptional regulator [Agrobacterium tumefaciens]|uniref:helix-turn-helix transcriptional regulator n=1 Tax=Agrobacterium tumefaciens TaxID=358 RepID=UPI0015734C5C|nr:AraC family transcriptional regulator [Agrobacterium tumefaciens]WCJ65137.1 AraC family transcriptional regulator [Agrobacterium tumefaciens]
MIERSDPHQKHDRLAAFLKAYGLRADYRGDGEKANLVIVDSEGAGEATHLIYRPRAVGVSGRGMTILAAATIDFGENLNPLVGALPEELCFGLASERELHALADMIVAESIDRRCGGGTIHARLCEVIVVLAIRKALAAGTVNAGLLAGLAHRQLHPSLVAMHEDPARRWHIGDLAAIIGMRRGRFIDIFKRTVGQPPAAYLTDWRLALGRSQLRSGRSVKTVAAAVGFGSAEAFSRSFTRKYGYPPSQERIAP